jgi:hypothetical protein
MNVAWVLGLDAVNLLCLIVICLCLLVVIHRRLTTPATK